MHPTRTIASVSWDGEEINITAIMHPTRTIYRNSPEGNAFYIIGACLQVMKSFYPDNADYRAARAAFLCRLDDLDYEGLCEYVIEQSRGRIVFSDADITENDILNTLIETDIADARHRAIAGETPPDTSIGAGERREDPSEKERS